MSATYVYKIKSKFKKNPNLLCHYGFSMYESEQDDEVIFAIGIRVSENTSVFQYIKKSIEKIYEKATPEEREKYFKQDEFKEITLENGHKKYELILTDEIIKEFSECQLCCVDRNLGAWTLFINAADRQQYYNSEVIYNCVDTLIDYLLQNKVIYKAKVKKQ